MLTKTRNSTLLHNYIVIFLAWRTKVTPTGHPISLPLCLPGGKNFLTISLRGIFLCLLLGLLLNGIAWLSPAATLAAGEPPEEISPSQIEKHLEKLIDPALGGRKAGSEEMEPVYSYLQNTLEEAGYTSQDTYPQNAREPGWFYQSFQAPVPHFHEPGKVEVVDGEGRRVEKYTQHQDFLIRCDDFSQGGEFTGNFQLVENREDLYGDGEKYREQGVLLDYQQLKEKTDLTEGEIDRRLVNEETKAVIYPEETEKVSSPHLDIGKKAEQEIKRGFIKIGIREEIFLEIKKYHQLENQSEKSIQVSAPLIFENNNMRSIFAYRPGESSPQGNYLLVAVPLDGTGKDPWGETFKGADRKAAPSALVLELARNALQKDYAKASDTTLVFGFFNGTHLGSLGEREYLKKPPFPPERTRVLYLEELGTQGELEINTFQDERARRFRAQNLLHQLETSAQKVRAPVSTSASSLQGGHSPFREAGIVAASITNPLPGESPEKEGIKEDYLVKTGQMVEQMSTGAGEVTLAQEFTAAVKGTWWWLLFLVPILIGRQYQTTLPRRFSTSMGKYPLLFIWLVVFFVLVILYYHTQYYYYEFTPLSYGEISIGLSEMGKELVRNLFPFLGMGFWFWAYLFPALIIWAATEFFCSFLPTYYRLGIVAAASGGSLIIPLSSLLDDYYQILFPNLLQIAGGEYYIPLLLTAVSATAALTLKKEKPEISAFQLTLIFMGMFYLLTVFSLAPHLYSSEIIELRHVDAKIRF